MTGEKKFIKEVSPYSNNYVTFKDEAKGNIVGKWKVVYLKLPNLEDVLIVEDWLLI